MGVNRQQVLNKFKCRCAYCGDYIDLKSMQVDHLIPQRNVGSSYHKETKEDVHSENNLMPSCRSCNNYKSGNSLEIFRDGIEMQIERLRRAKPTFRLAERFGLINCTPKKVVFYFETLKELEK